MVAIVVDAESISFSGLGAVHGTLIGGWKLQWVTSGGVRRPSRRARTQSHTHMYMHYALMGSVIYIRFQPFGCFVMCGCCCVGFFVRGYLLVFINPFSGDKKTKQVRIHGVHSTR